MIRLQDDARLLWQKRYFFIIWMLQQSSGVVAWFESNFSAKWHPGRCGPKGCSARATWHFHTDIMYIIPHFHSCSNKTRDTEVHFEVEACIAYTIKEQGEQNYMSFHFWNAVKIKHPRNLHQVYESLLYPPPPPLSAQQKVMQTHCVSCSSCLRCMIRNAQSGEHIDLNALQTQTGPDKVVITVGGVYTIT